MTGRHVSGTAHGAASDEADGPLVSVVIPCHQGAAFVDQALAPAAVVDLLRRIYRG